MHLSSFDLPSRARAAAVHLGLSAGVAAAAAALVFLVWYPMPYRETSGGRELFLLIVAVDVAIGPLITFTVFNRRKPRGELVRDLCVVAAIQLVALGYGLYSVALARPVVVALEGDRLRVVRAIDLAGGDLARAPEGLQRVSWAGPIMVAARPPSAEEKIEAIDRGLAGEDIGMRPQFWRPPGDTGAAYAKAARPLQDLMKRRPSRAAEIERAGSATGLPIDQIGFLPLLARNTDWSVLVDRQSGRVVGYVNAEGF